VNEGRATVYGGSVRLDLVQVLDLERRVEAHAALALANGREWPHHAEQSDEHRPIGAMSPVQLQLGADVDWGNWSVAPRLGIVGRQRLVATIGEGDAVRRRTLDGHAVMNVNIRRNRLFKNVDAFVTVENAFDRRYRHINGRAYSNPEELIGAPQNPRRFTVGLDLRIQ